MTNDKSPQTTTGMPEEISSGQVTSGQASVMEHSKHADLAAADEAMKIFQGRDDGTLIELGPVAVKKLVWKIDRNLMPLMCIVYGLNFLDKSALTYGSVMGLKTDLHINGDQYSWLGSIFYFGYLVVEYPTARLLQKLPLAKWSGANIVVWGIVLTTFAGTHNFGGAMANRFFLGLFEATVTPSFALLTSQWYTKYEQGLRVGIWFGANGVSVVLGSCIAYGISVSTKDHPAALAGWRIVSLAFGLFTIFVGVLFLLWIPDSQLNARWLTEDERLMAVERIRVNQQGVGNKTFKWYQFQEALTDPITWAYVVFALGCNIPNGGITNFFAQLILGFGYTADQSLLYSAPGGAIQVVTMVGFLYLGDRYRNRILVASSGLFIAIIGILLMICLPLSSKNGRLAGYYLTFSSNAAFVALMSLIASNIAGYTKKTTVAAFFLISYCAGNIVGPQTFRAKDAPRYVPAEITIVCCWGVCLLDLAFIYVSTPPIG